MLWSKVLSTAPLALLWLGSVSATPVWLNALVGRAPERPAKIVYRGDRRSPREVRDDGGFRPVGNYAAHDRTFSTYRHMVGEHGIEDEPDFDPSADNPWTSAFVSVTTDLQTGTSYGRWVYRIHATPNMIDPTEPDDGEPEIFALGGVHWSQVMGWYRMNLDSEETITDANFTPNPDYRGDRYDQSTLTNVDSDSDWRDHDRQHWTQHMNRPDVGHVVGFTGQFPLQFDTYPPNDSIPGATETQEERPISPSPAGAQRPALNEEEILLAAEYLREHNAPCDLSGLDPMTQWLTLEADSAIARALARMRQTRPNRTHSTIDEADETIQAIIARLREGEERSTCHLAAACGSSFSQRKRAPKDAALSRLCHKIHTPKKERPAPNKGKETTEPGSPEKGTDRCDTVKDLEFGFQLSDESSSGTYDRLEAILTGPSGQARFEIADAPSLGFHKWFPLDVKIFGSNTLDLKKGITKVELTAAGHYEGPKNDQFQVQGFKLRGQCVESGYQVVVDKYASLNTWYQHKSTGIISDQLKAQTVATFDVARDDWHMRPPCSYMEELKFDFQLIDSDGAGTYDALLLSFGTAKTFPLGNGPSRGLVVSSPVDLKETFNTDELAVRDLDRVSILDLPSADYFGRDIWGFKGVTLKARCAASNKWMEMKKYSEVNKWLQHGGKGYHPEGVWSGHIVPEDWREV